MKQTKRNDIAKYCESLRPDELLELCKNLIAENEEIKSEYDELHEMFWLLVSKGWIELE